MSVLATHAPEFYSSEEKRRWWQEKSKKQHSFSLDIPRNSIVKDGFNKFVNFLESQESLRSREEDRVFLYLPRNLSYCEVCSDVILDHIQKKVKLLSSRLCQYDDVPPTPVTSDFPFSDFENNDDDGMWTGNIVPVIANGESPTFSSKIKGHHSILKRNKRAVSFPAPRRDGKKVVRFADALGLELESVRYLVQKDILSVVPSASGVKKLTNGPKCDSKKIQLVPAFLAPSLSKDFKERLHELSVCLHSVSTADSTVYGIISVVNLTFHKNVFVRYTANAWMSYHDEVAFYIEGSSADDTDKFSFTLFCNPSDLCTSGHSMFFAICYETPDNQMYWDNNSGKNYCIKCEIKEIPSVGNHSWVHFL